MNNSTYSNRNSLNTTFCNLSKINPFNARKTINGQNIKSLKKKYIIPNTSREFGKEINISSILTTSTNTNVNNTRRSFGIPVKNNKKEKEEMNNKLKNIKKIEELKKKKKELHNSLPYKPNSSNGKITMNKSSTEQFKKGITKIKIKNQSQKNILNMTKTNMTINNTLSDDIIMIDENTNPNSIFQDINNNVTKNDNKNQVCDNFDIKETKNNNNKDEEDVLMKVENTNEVKKDIKNKNISNNNEINVVVPYNSKPQEVTEYFDDICEEISKNEDKYLVDPQYMSHQSDINHRMRAILIDWLIDVHLKYKLLPQTMYIAVNLIDRYLEKVDTNRVKLQLVGITAMFIATKYEEIYPRN
jgi:hypothetical protein